MLYYETKNPEATQSFDELLFMHNFLFAVPLEYLEVSISPLVQNMCGTFYDFMGHY